MMVSAGHLVSHVIDGVVWPAYDGHDVSHVIVGVVWPAYDGHDVSHVIVGGCLASL